MNTTTLDGSSVLAVSSVAPKHLYRLLLLRKKGSELLVACRRPPNTLPCVEIPRWERVAENVIAAVSKRYGISALCLFTPEISSTATDGKPLYLVMEAREAGNAAPNETRWLRMNSFLDQSCADHQDLVAITVVLNRMRESQRNKANGPFGAPGWIEGLFIWAKSAIEPYGLCLSGQVRQLNASSTFALLRLETNNQAVWFKAVGEPNLRELPISVTLSNLFPGFVPTVIATHPAWNGWLTTEFAGSTLDESPDNWERAAQTLGELQIAAVGKTDQLLDAGCRDLRVTSLLTLVDPFMGVMVRLMEEQRETPPPILDRDELRRLGSEIKKALSDLAKLDIPDTLGHLDLNPGNILCSANQCIFLDWAEAYVGPPFLTFEYLREHLARLLQKATNLRGDLVKPYETTWRRIISPETVSAALDLAPVVAVFAYAAGTGHWRNTTSRREPRVSGHLRSLTRRMHLEIQRLRERRRLCGN